MPRHKFIYGNDFEGRVRGYSGAGAEVALNKNYIFVGSVVNLFACYINSKPQFYLAKQIFELLTLSGFPGCRQELKQCPD
jgi:hypothetical protein